MGSMNEVRKIAQATGAWLQYEFACGRSNLFNEARLSTPISSVLEHLFPHQVHSEFLHPSLAAACAGRRGRRPEVDFAVTAVYPKITCVVESKWVGRNGLTAEDVIWDLLRLELIAHQEQASAFFVLAGRRKHLEAFFQSRAFLGKRTARGTYKRLLKLDRRRNARIVVDSPTKDREAIFHKMLADYPTISFPSRITTSRPSTYPESCPTFQYQAYAWQVIVPAGTRRFLPSNHSRYSQLLTKATLPSAL
jgi:hypothetical protein